jgi:hypothetical protein
MKVLIKESKYNNLIENYILNGYPVVKNVTFTTRDVYLASGDKSERRTIQRNIINVEFRGNEMQISPTRTLREIRADINRMFGLRIDESGSNWGIEYKIYSLTE